MRRARPVDGATRARAHQRYRGCTHARQCVATKHVPPMLRGSHPNCRIFAFMLRPSLAPARARLAAQAYEAGTRLAAGSAPDLATQQASPTRNQLINQPSARGSSSAGRSSAAAVEYSLWCLVSTGATSTVLDHLTS